MGKQYKNETYKKQHKNESFIDFKSRRAVSNRRRRESDRERGRCPK